ncbi:MAG: MATE family efflux transporter [Lachnospiraceae bacterium]|nr:MATE family efflux transporter [Lachnospiraceae bacterium]
MKTNLLDRKFISRTLTIAIPIMLQNGVTNLVNMLDNIMVGRVGTDAMTGVAIINQLMFVWILCIFGGLSGIGIFTAQYFGKGDNKGVRDTFRLQVLLSLLLTAAGFIILKMFHPALINLYMHEDGGGGNIAATMENAVSYLNAIYFGLIPFALAQAYSNTMRSVGETVDPMRASILAVIVNLVGNYVLIYGKFGAPALGVVGAAIATNISRFVELGYLVIRTHLNTKKYPFIVGAYASFSVPGRLVKNCVIKGTPLLINEALWSAGEAVQTQIFSRRGLSVVSALNISMTIGEVFNVAFIAMGSATAIIIGQELGAFGRTDPERVKRDAWRLTWYSVILCVLSGLLLFVVSGIFPMIYNTSGDIRELAAGFIRINALFMPMYAFENAAYFTIRSGGKTIITFFFDSCFTWLASIPLSYALVTFTAMPILMLLTCVKLIELVKCAIGAFLMQKGIWINDIT